MSAPHADPIIAGYMARLKEALSALPAGRRDEIMAQIHEHITEARAALTEETDADVLDLLDRIGNPADIAEEARERLGLPHRGPGPLEIGALLLIGLSGLILPIPPVGWVVGVALVWLSPCWSARQKRRGAYLPLVIGLAVGLLAVLTGPLTHSHNIPLILAAAILLPVASAVYLVLRLGRRLRPIAWTGLALVTAIVLLGPMTMLLPTRTYAFVGSAGPPGRPEFSLAATHCGGFYGTTEYGLGMAGRVSTSVGVCFDGNQVRKTWGPDCYANYGPIARIDVTPCTVEARGDGSLLITSQSTATSNLGGPFQFRSVGIGWVVTPDEVVHQPPG
jgi:hypothetical protein